MFLIRNEFNGRFFSNKRILQTRFFKLMSAEPKSWAEILKQREAERNQPPPRDSYTRPVIKKYEEGGIFAIDSDGKSHIDPDDYVMTDTHMYSTTSIFDPEEEKPQHFKPSHDHGIDFLAWPKKSKYAKPEPQKARPITKRDEKTRDFDLISGKPFASGFKSTVKTLLDQKEQSKQFRVSRSFDTITNTFPTQELEATRAQNEELERLALITSHLDKMPPNERRSNGNSVNIITGEFTDPDALSSIKEFPNPSAHRAKLAIEQENLLVTKREEERQKEVDRIGCRFNNGRSRELRDWNIVNGTPMHSCMAESVKMKPSVWDWCKKESLDA